MRHMRHSLLLLAAQILLAPRLLAQSMGPDPDPWKPDLPFAVAVFVIVTIVATTVVRRLKRKRREKSDEERSDSHGQIKGGAPKAPELTGSRTRASGGSLFISYRRSDTADITGRIYDRLVEYFGKQRVFKDVDSIPLGIDFRQHIDAAISESRVAIAVIGKDWLDVRTEAGDRRLDDSRDHLRIEVEVALQRNIPLVPVLVQGASLPTEDDLPQSLRLLAFRNGIEVRPDPDFHGDMDRLIRGINAHFD